ncbi:auxilin-related protein 2-like [Durio zibethinus]|uniref:Auxilin-related protein 2-like n=1 Tax=Durio zibethinus TaxID=66656 RepID=A0A6P6B354_DURZI|nr:auxilin-related protein 2-like [Durio zibethinus]XP_022771613.1 auxilin-related protein 2-like [Durio zibethinus]
MDDFPGLLAKDFGIKPQGKSAPMAPLRNPSSGPKYGLRSEFTTSSSGYGKSSSNSIFDDQDRDGLIFNDLYGGTPKYFSESRTTTEQTSSFDYDSLFKDPKPPVFDKPVYDDDLFDGLPGIKSSSSTSARKYDDVFTLSGSPPPPKHKSLNSSPFDELLGNLGRKGTETMAKSERVKVEKDAPLFDDLLPGFGRSSSPASARSISEAGQSHKPASNSSKAGSNLMEDPFVVLETTSDPADSSSGLFTDPLEEISKLNGSRKSRVESTSGSGGVFDDIDPLDGLGKSVPPLSPEINKRGKDRGPLKTASGPQTPASKEPSDEDYEHHTKKRMPSMDNIPESHQTVFDMPSISTDFHSSVGRTTSPPPYSNVSSNETSSQVNTTPRSEENFDASDDVWLTVSEIPLFTQPTSAPPPSRPPPPRPPRVSKAHTGSFSSINAKKKVNDFSSFQNSTQFSHSPQSARAPARSSITSQIDELEDFAMGRARNNVEQVEVFPGDDFETNSVAAASAAAMKEAMDRAEAKFRHAKEMRERENLKTARNKETGQMDKDERTMQQDALDREVREKQERLERERQQREREEEEREQMRRELEREREEKEREQKRRELEREREEKERAQRRLEKERERVREMEREREMARQVVERAAREARERVATEARARAERAAVEKAAAEARERAERAAVQRVQAEARERAAAEARERAERAAAEAREREARERTATAKAEAEARLRAERAAVERAAAEARERAAAEAQERAAAARASQQKNDNDLESFFSMGSRPSSAPGPRASSSEPMFDGQNKVGPEVARRTSVGSSSSMRKASSSANIVDDLSSIFGAAASSSGEFQEVEGETEERRRARLERHQRTQERAAKALAEKNQRDLQVQREQAERHRIAETLDVEIKRWAAGKEGNLRALLSTLQYVLWPECGWQPVSLTDLITAAAVKKAYRKATLCIHPDKVQQKGANLQQKYVAEKVFDLLKEAWNKFNSEELF